jgi:hypothetical protein
MNGLVGTLAGDARCLVRVDDIHPCVHGWRARLGGYRTGHHIHGTGACWSKARVAFGICAIVWLAWGIASWRFLFGK